MKKLYKVISIIICVLIVYFLSVIIFNKTFCKAYIDLKSCVIQYNGKNYQCYSDLFDYSTYPGEPSNITGVLSDSFFDYIIFPREYIYYLNEDEDANTSFIVDESVTTLVYVEENFVFPNIKDDTIEAVWLSWDTSNVVQDENIVDELVRCAIYGENRPLNKEMCNLNAEGTNVSCYFKFKGYPITANFEMKTAENGTFYLKEQDGDDKYSVILDQDFLNER